MIDPTKFLPDRELLNVASKVMSDLLAVEAHKSGVQSLLDHPETLDVIAKLAYAGTFALLREQNRLFREAHSTKVKKPCGAPE